MHRKMTSGRLASVVLLLLFDTFVVRRNATLKQWLAAE